MSLITEHRRNAMFRHPTSVAQREQERVIANPPPLTPVQELSRRHNDEKARYNAKAQREDDDLDTRQQREREQNVVYRNQGGVPQQMAEDHAEARRQLSMKFRKDRADMRHRHRIEMEAALERFGAAQ